MILVAHVSHHLAANFLLDGLTGVARYDATSGDVDFVVKDHSFGLFERLTEWKYYSTTCLGKSLIPQCQS